MAYSAEQLFDRDFLQRLERLTIHTRRAVTGKYSGARASARKGSAVEFSDYRQYEPGDDFRLIDWKAYARFEKLFLKLFMEEQETTISLLVDTSTSMGFGNPAKGRLARQLAGALAYLGLGGGDAVSAGGFSAGLDKFMPPVRGRAMNRRVWDFLAGLPEGGASDFNSAMKNFAYRRQGAGVTVVISDLLSPAGFEEGLKYLLYLKQEVVLIQLLEPEEIDPAVRGDWRLVDSETGATTEITITPALLKTYRARVETFITGIRTFCHRYGIGYTLCRSDLPLDEIFLKYLLPAGIIQ